MVLAELGTVWLLAALALAVISLLVSVTAGTRDDERLARIGRRVFYGLLLGVAAASATLVAALVVRDFSIAYVWEHTDRSLSLPLTVAAFYAGQEGSLLYWVLLLSLVGSAALAAASTKSQRMTAFANVVLSGIVTFFLIVLAFVGNPFDLLPVTPSDGLGLNPVLRDGGMLAHPPFLLAGYSAFAVPFAFAMAALLAGRDEVGWIAHTRRFAMLAWGLQTVGLTLGMWWAYHVLGWGGYWGWDPVENAALMPWLATTAFLHTARVQEQRRTLRAWGYGLVVAAFLLSILGTFIVRSGILPSVHTFAVSRLGPWFFGFLVLAVISTGAVLVRRSEWLRSPEPVEASLSREGAMVLQNVVLVGLTAAVLWGTLLPLFSRIVGPELVVGASYYERVAAPLFVALLALLAIGPLLPWRQGPLGGRSLSLLRWPLGAAVVALGILLLAGVYQPAVLLTLPLVVAGVATCMVEYGRGAGSARRRGGSWPAASLRELTRNRRRYGAYLAHVGILVVAAGMIGSHFWQQSRQVTMHPGQSVTMGRYTLTYQGVAQQSLGDHSEQVARLRLGDETLEPARSTYGSLGGQALTHVAIRSTPIDDLYVVLAAPADGDTATLNIFVNPLVTWIWGGAALLILGVLLGQAGGRQPATDRARAVVTAPAPAR